MSPENQSSGDESAEATQLPIRNEMHYDSRVFASVDRTQRGAYMEQRHGITPEVADDALGDANRVVIDPDYNSTSGRSVRIIGFSAIAEEIITVIVLQDGGIDYGVNGCGQREGPPPLHWRRTA
jgi:hypothetical protein